LTCEFNFCDRKIFQGLAQPLQSVVNRNKPVLVFGFAMISKDHKSIRQSPAEAQREVAVDDNRTQHVRLVFAVHRLEACLGQAAPGRESCWQEEVNKALDLLLAAMRESRDCVCKDDGLIAEIQVEKPFLMRRVKNLRAEFDGLFNQASALQDQIKDAADTQQISFADLRQRMDWLISGLKLHQAKEADLVYEAINVDIGVGD
jgi:hypothetical protein